MVAIVPTGSIGNEVFFDKNGDGIRNPGEGLAGVVVGLDTTGDGVSDLFTVTDADGLYQFNNLVAGNYTVAIDTSSIPGGVAYTNTVDPDGGANSTSFVALAAGENNTAQDFGYRAFDFGDAPDSYGTTSAANGARHVLSVGQTAATPLLGLGATVDAEGNGAPSAGADGDDLAGGGDDEDGIQFLTAIQASQAASIQVNVREGAGVDGRLSAWIDFNRDGDFADAGEKIASDVAVVNGVNTLNFTVAAGALAGDTYARFRLSTDLGLGATGEASNGEVEDYKVAITAAPVGSIGNEVFFDKNGNGVRDAGEGFAGVNVLLDTNNDGTFDRSTVTDANGVYLFTDLTAGAYRVLVDAATLPGFGNYSNTVDPDGGSDNTSLVNLGIGENNLAQDFGYRGFDYGDAPDSYGTTNVANGARHVLSIGQTVATPALFLGATVDIENNGAPGVAANGDDTGFPGVDDEDGIQFLTAIQAGQAASIQVNVREGAGVDGRLSAWIDFNRDGDFADAGEKILSDVAVSDGVQTLSFTAAAGALSGDTYARFRLSTDLGLGATGQASNGEVEDYKVAITAAPVGSIGNEVFFDKNGNGVRDAGEGFAGATVRLDKDNNGTIDATTTTDANGVYSFGGLAAGTYKVIVDTTTLAGGVSYTNTTDPDGGANSMSVVNLGVGENNVAQDFGYRAFDFGDAPDIYGTTSAANGARHVLSVGQTAATPLLGLGATVDAEGNGAPSAGADGDDLAGGGDDEDAVTFLTAIQAGQAASIQLNVREGAGVDGRLSAWIDFNRDGDFADAGEKIASDVAVVNGANTLNFTTAASAVAGDTYARFRLTTDTGIGATGEASNGEVEDYKVSLVAAPKLGIDIEKFVKGRYVVESGGGEGLTPGFWKTHSEFGPAPLAGWPETGFSPTQSWETLFGANVPGTPTLLEALGAEGGGTNALLRHSTAALLNAANPYVSYAYSVDQVTAMTRAAINSGDASQIESTKDLFATQNELGADLSTPAGSTVVETAYFDADAPGSGPNIPVNGEAIFKYEVKNTGEVALSDIQVTDDRLSNVTFVGGDSDGDRLLDLNETWTYSASEIVGSTSVNVMNIGTVTGRSGGTTVSDSDAANYKVNGLSQTIGDRVWYDTDSDGFQDTNEVGASGVTVKLLNSSTFAVLQTQTTDTNGNYLFQLAPGDYVVEVVRPTGFSFSPSNIGTNDMKDSDVSTVSGRTAVINIQSGEQDLSWDAGLIAECVAVTFDFNGNSSTDGTDGNSRSWTDGSTGLSVTARAFSQDKGTDNWQKAYVGAYGGGLGVTDSSEGSGGSNTHTVDNVGRNNFVVFQFSEEVTLDKAYLGYVVGDSDMQVWIGNSASAITSMSNAKLASLGYSELNDTTSSSARWADLNAGEVSGNTIIIAADTTDTSPEDYFKIQKLVVCASTPASNALDFGDAPDSYGTSIAVDGARHVQAPATPALYLGARVDAEGNGAPSVGANGDDLAGSDDEDGIYFLTAIEAGDTAQIKVTVREAAGVNGKLSGWIDFNRDGDFNDAGEKILSDVAVVDGVQTLSFTAAGNAIAGDSYARFRLSTDSGLGATGQASNGEVEDYKIKIAPACVPVTFDFNGNSSTDGTDGNSRSWTDSSTGLGVTARAFSQDKGTDYWQKAYVGAYGGGLGVTDSSEGSGGSNTHTVDNVGRNNFVVFQFSEEVTLDKAYLGYVVGDSDMQVWIGNSASAITSMSNAKLASLGYSELNDTTSSSARWADLNAGEVSGNTIIIAADTTDTSPEDYFKIQKLAVCASTLISNQPVDGCFV